MKNLTTHPAVNIDAATKEAYNIYLNAGYDPTNFEASYQGKYNSKEYFAQERINNLLDLDDLLGNLASYINYKKFSRDLFMSDYWYHSGHVFRRL